MSPKGKVKKNFRITNFGFRIQKSGLNRKIKRTAIVTLHAVLLAAMIAASLPMEAIAAGINHLAGMQQKPPEEDISEGMTLGLGDTSSEPVPILEDQIAAQAAAPQNAQDSIRLKLTAEPAIYLPGKPLHITWKLKVGGQETVSSRKPAVKSTRHL